ncbi:MAG: ABC transporter ATP-binding protein, partial [bacterium]
GEIKMHGKVASLLEVGTGFHQELTGRENIFLNGAILGMTKEEIAEKFDAIVEFSGVKKFIDTPVKRYSSGMMVRLGFSVAAHMEPDILLVDEVLAVGDAEFQKKCLGKMDEVTSQAGRTILFVSHNLTAVQKLCKRCILLEEGKIKMIGETKDVINYYLRSKIGSSASKKWTDINSAPGDDVVRLCAVKVKQENQTTDTVNIQLPVEIEMEYKVIKSGSVLIPNYHFFNESGICIFVSSDQDPEWQRKIRRTGTYKSSVLIPGNFLSDGILTVGVAISTFTPISVHFYEQDAIAFRIVEDFENSPTRGEYMGSIPGILRPLLNWKTQFNENNIIKTK